jgi:hypothetical protein
MATKLKPPTTVLTIDQAIQHLKDKGTPLSETTIRQAALRYEAGEPDGLKCFRKGGIPKYGRLGFPLAEFDAWAEKRGGWIDASK